MSLTAPPYIMYWNTETASAGNHVITASATGVTGSSGVSAPVTVTVTTPILQRRLAWTRPYRLTAAASCRRQDSRQPLRTCSWLSSPAADHLPGSRRRRCGAECGAGRTQQLSTWRCGDLGCDVQRSTIRCYGFGSTGYWQLIPRLVDCRCIFKRFGARDCGSYERSIRSPDCPIPGGTAVSGQVLVPQLVDTQVGDTSGFNRRRARRRFTPWSIFMTVPRIRTSGTILQSKSSRPVRDFRVRSGEAVDYASRSVPSGFVPSES